MYTDVTGQRKFGLVQYFIVTPGDVVLVVVRTLVQLGVTCQEHFQLTSPAVDKASKFTLVRDSEVLDVTFVDCMHSEMYVYFF